MDDVVLTESHDLMRDGIREVGARNGRYKVLCTNSTDVGNCTFFNLLADPLEEYPLAIPDSCSDNARRLMSDPDWHYCDLTNVVAAKSFMR
jgi:hypothetical protein